MAGRLDDALAAGRAPSPPRVLAMASCGATWRRISEAMGKRAIAAPNRPSSSAATASAGARAKAGQTRAIRRCRGAGSAASTVPRWRSRSEVPGAGAFGVAESPPVSRRDAASSVPVGVTMRPRPAGSLGDPPPVIDRASSVAPSLLDRGASTGRRGSRAGALPPLASPPGARAPPAGAFSGAPADGVSGRDGGRVGFEGGAGRGDGSGGGGRSGRSGGGGRFGGVTGGSDGRRGNSGVATFRAASAGRSGIDTAAAGAVTVRSQPVNRALARSHLALSRSACMD